MIRPHSRIQMRIMVLTQVVTAESIMDGSLALMAIILGLDTALVQPTIANHNLFRHQMLRQFLFVSSYLAFVLYSCSALLAC